MKYLALFFLACVSQVSLAAGSVEVTTKAELVDLGCENPIICDGNPLNHCEFDNDIKIDMHWDTSDNTTEYKIYSMDSGGLLASCDSYHLTIIGQ